MSIFRRILHAACLLLFSLAVGATAHAQDPQVTTAREWSPVAAIPGYYEDTLPPILVADSNRTVHAFATLPLSDDPNELKTSERAIFYRQWTLEGGWTESRDIMLTPIKKQARVKGVFLDDSDILHMVFYGGDEQESYIWYTWAPASQAAFAASWSRPLALGGNAGSGIVASIIGDGGDNLVAIYSGDLGEGNSLYAIYSNDAGVTWGEPELVFSTYAGDIQPGDFYWSRGESGAVHMVWNVMDWRGQNLTAFYAQLQDMERHIWSEPLVVDNSVGLGLASLSVIEHQGQVLLIYNNGKEGEVFPVMWLKRSTDGGKTFGNPAQPFPNHIGRNGPVAFVVDSQGTLYGFFGQRIPGGFDGSIDLHGMWQTVWQGNNWGPVTPVVSGPFSQSFDPGDATPVISQGNVILLTWRTDPGRDITGTWYTYRALDVPELPVTPLAVPAVAIGSAGADGSPGAVSSLLPTVTPNPIIAVAPALAEPTQVAGPSFTLPQEDVAIVSVSPAAPIVNALIPVALFVAAALLFAGARRRHS